MKMERNVSWAMADGVENLNDVMNFSKALIKEGTAFHPDDDFTEYMVTSTSTPAYSDNEAKLRNMLMERCFVVCQREGVDIYDFMLEVSLKETGMETLIPLPSQIFEH